MKAVLYGNDGAVMVLDNPQYEQSRYLEVPSFSQPPPRWRDGYTDGVTPPDMTVTVRKRTFVCIGRGQRAAYYEEIP